MPEQTPSVTSLRHLPLSRDKYLLPEQQLHPERLTTEERRLLSKKWPLPNWYVEQYQLDVPVEPEAAASFLNDRVIYGKEPVDSEIVVHNLSGVVNPREQRLFLQSMMEISLSSHPNARPCVEAIDLLKEVPRWQRPLREALTAVMPQ